MVVGYQQICFDVNRCVLSYDLSYATEDTVKNERLLEYAWIKTTPTPHRRTL